MRKRTLLLLAIFPAVLAAYLIWVVLRSPEPHYDGRSLSYWLDESCAPTLVRQHQATQAILQIGTNALPYLLRYIKYEQPSWKKTTTAQFAKLRGLPRAGRFIPRFLYTDRAAVRAEMAMEAFLTLAQTAGPAHPHLAALACDSTQPEASDRAIRVLTWTRSMATNALGLVLSNGPPKTREQALSFIIVQRDMRILRALQPTLIHCLHDPEDEVAKRAADALTWLKHAEPEEILAILVEGLHTTTPAVRATLIQCIATYGTGAAPAVPSVVPLLVDPELSVRKEATNLLRMIAPQALTNAPAP